MNKQYSNNQKNKIIEMYLSGMSVSYLSMGQRRYLFPLQQ